MPKQFKNTIIIFVEFNEKDTEESQSKNVTNSELFFNRLYKLNTTWINPIPNMYVIKTDIEASELDKFMMESVENELLITYYLQLVDEKTHSYNGFLPVNTFQFLEGLNLTK